MIDYAQVKKGHRAIWALGDFDKISKSLSISTDQTMRVAKVRPGEKVLDVATGTGITAIAARERTAHVAGIDLTPELIETAKVNAKEVGFHDIDFREGDAEALPFPDESFDVVLSTCGHMFAPDQPTVAKELARVTKKNGRVAFLAWTPEGGVGKLFKITAKHVPPAPGMSSPFNWGDPEKVANLLQDHFREITFTPGDCPEFADKAEDIWHLFSTYYGPTVKALAALPPEGQKAFREDMISFFDGYRASDGKVRWGREFVITHAIRR